MHLIYSQFDFKSNIFIALLFVSANIVFGSTDPDEHRDAIAIINSRGFKAEVHYVTTKDGYILALHRITNPHLSPNAALKPILLQHGLLGSSTDWIINSPLINGYEDNTSGGVGNNLGFVLAINGYDAWLANSRGNTYSTNHTTLDPNKNEFWRFSFDEMSEYDLTAIINYIIKTTNTSSIGYIGHSQGTAIMFALLASQPHYSQLINPFIALAPVAFVYQIKSPVRYLAPFSEILRIKGGKFLPSDELVKVIADIVCDHEFRFICSNFLFLLAGFDAQQLNMTRLGVYFTHTPAGTSTWDVIHFAQLVESKMFRKFDFGKSGNEKVYNQSTPPEYNLAKINSNNIALIYSLNDWLADINDVRLLKSKLNVTLLDDYLVPNDKWTHTDFIFGKDAGKMVYTRVLAILRSVLF